MMYRNDQATSKLGTSGLPRNSMAGAYLLAMWCPVFRWRDSDPGSGTELENSLALLWQFKGTFRGISVGYEFRIGKAKRRRYLWKRKNCQSSARQCQGKPYKCDTRRGKVPMC